MKKRPVVSMDLGGTNIRLGLVDARGTVLRRRRVPMFSAGSKHTLLRALGDVIASFIEANSDLPSPGGVCIGFAGPTKASEGCVYFAPNISRMSDIEVGSYLEGRLEMRVMVENDANCAALGEYWHGAGKGASSLFLFTLGTGVGGSLVIDGKLWQGYDGIAGEIGHTVIDIKGPKCACGQRGCLETLVSATAMIKDYGKRKRIKTRPRDITAKMIADKAKQGDRTAMAVMRGASEALGVGIANVFHLYNPELILVGGGVSRAGSILLAPAVSRAREAIFPQLRSRLKVRRTRLGDDSALVGAAYLAHQSPWGQS
ncbi:MAG: ROK family protein [Candidatus Eisenbacteria bacterium]